MNSKIVAITILTLTALSNAEVKKCYVDHHPSTFCIEGMAFVRQADGNLTQIRDSAGRYKKCASVGMETKVGDIRTFSNGKLGRWNGTGWETLADGYQIIRIRKATADDF